MTPTRKALLDADQALVTARRRVVEIEERAARLRDLAGAEEAEAAEAKRAVAADPSEASLARAASRICAAAIARDALPSVEAELHAAGAEAVRLEQERGRAVAAMLLEHADEEGRAYAAAFRHLAAIHDRLVGIGRALAPFGGDIAMAVEPFEAPRFRLPALAGGEYSLYLRHVPDARVIGAAAQVWSTMARRLKDDPLADITDLLAPDAKVERDAAPEALGLTIHHDRNEEPGERGGAMVVGGEVVPLRSARA